MKPGTKRYKVVKYRNGYRTEEYVFDWFDKEGGLIYFRDKSNRLYTFYFANYELYPSRRTAVKRLLGKLTEEAREYEAIWRDALQEIDRLKADLSYHLQERNS